MKKLLAYPLVTLTAVLSLLIGFHMGGFQLAISSASASFGLGITGMGVLASVYSLSMVCVPLLAGLVADRTGKKPVLCIGVAAALAGCVVAYVSHSLVPFAVGVFLLGGGGVIMEGNTAAAITDLYPNKSARFINLCQCFFSIGAITGPLLLQALMDRQVDWKMLYVIYFIAAACCIVPLLRTRIPGAPSGPAQKALGNPLRILLRPAFFLLFLGIVLYVGLENGFAYFAKTLFDLRLSAGHLGAYAISAFWAGMALSRLFFGTRTTPARQTVLVAFALSAAMLAGLALSRSAVLSLCFCALAGAAYAPIWSCLMAMAAVESPGQSSGAVGLMTTGCGIGGALYPIVMGAMADQLPIHVPFLLLAATAAVGAAALVVYGRVKARQNAAR